MSALRQIALFALLLQSAFLLEAPWLHADGAIGAGPTAYTPATQEEASAMRRHLMNEQVFSGDVRNAAAFGHDVRSIPINLTPVPEAAAPASLPAPETVVHIPLDMQSMENAAGLADALFGGPGFIQISIKDEGYGLTDGDRTRIGRFLKKLPPWHLAGLTTVIVRPLKDLPSGSSRIQLVGSQLIIYADKKIKDRKDSLIQDVATGVGLHVYNGLSNNQLWNQLPLSKRLADLGSKADAFAAEYARYTHLGSARSIGKAITGPEPGKDLPTILYMASNHFTRADGRVQVYRNEGEGKVTSGTKRVKMADGWLTISGYSFEIKNHQMTGWLKGNVFTKYPPPKPGQEAVVIVSNSFLEPIKLPPLMSITP